jgi:hypothetical protein
VDHRGPNELCNKPVEAFRKLKVQRLSHSEKLRVVVALSSFGKLSSVDFWKVLIAVRPEEVRRAIQRAGFYPTSPP